MVSFRKVSFCQTRALHLWWILFILAPCQLVLGQDQTKDSLLLQLEILEQNNFDPEVKKKQIGLLIDLAQHYFYISSDSTQYYSKKILKISESINYPRGKYWGHFIEGNIQSTMGDSEEALSSYQKALDIAKTMNDGILVSETLNLIATEHVYLWEYENALSIFLKALDEAHGENDLELASIINMNIALMYGVHEQYTEALQFFTKVLEINNELEDDITTANTLTNLASINSELKMHGKALDQINVAIEVLEKEPDIWLAYAYNVKGKIYRKDKQYHKALQWLQKSEAMYGNLDPQIKIELLYERSCAYFGLGDVEKARKNALEGHALAQTHQQTVFERNFLELMYKLSKMTGRNQEALTYHEQFLNLSDSIHLDKNKISLSLYRIKVSHEEDKAKLMATSDQKLLWQRNFGYTTVFLLMALLTILIPLYMNRKKLKQLLGQLRISSVELKKRKMELSGLNETKDRLFSIIGHDLRGPVGALKKVLETATLDQAKGPNPIQLLPKLEGDVDHALFTLNNLLSWGNARIKDNKSKRTSTDVKQLIDINCNSMDEMAQKKSIKIINEVPQQCDVMANTDQIDVVLRNLISNAIKFTPEHGLISIEAEAQKDQWLFKIKDSGIGIDDITLKQLFKKNTNHSTYGTNNEKGTGLGLSLCRDMIQRNNGDIWAVSIPKKGSTFFFTLPKAVSKNR